MDRSLIAEALSDHAPRAASLWQRFVDEPSEAESADELIYEFAAFLLSRQDNDVTPWVIGAALRAATHATERLAESASGLVEPTRAT